MAPKKPTAFEQPPRADSSSEDEEEVSNEEEEEEVSEESEEEELMKPDPKPVSSSEEDGSDSGSDEEVTPAVPVKPVEVQSPKVGAKSKQKQPDPAPATAPASAVTVAVDKSGKKRLGESKADGKDSKKLKKVADVEDKRVAEEKDVKKVGEDPKKQLFQRLFSEEDEIEMLKALLDYSAKKCVDPIEDFNEFHDLLKNFIHVDVSSAQLADKIRRTKKKYEKNAGKTKEGVDKTFGKPHEQLCYDLSKKIWGKAASASGGSEFKANGKGKRTPKPNMTPVQKEKHASSLQIPQVVKKDEPVRENSSSLFCLSELAKTKDVVGMMGLSDDLCKKGFDLLSDEARAALEEKWKNMATAELELYCNRLELSREHVKLSLDALKASGHLG